MKYNATIAICDTHEAAEEVVKKLHQKGFDMKTLSIVGKNYHEEDKVVGFYNRGDIIKSWGSSGAFWGGIWGLVFGAGFFLVPGIGPLIIAGPIISSLVGAIEGAVLVGGFSAIGAALYTIGVPKDSILKYETALKADKFLVIVHGDKDINKKAHELMIEDTKQVETY